MKQDKFNFIAAIIMIFASMIGYVFKTTAPDYYDLSELVCTEAPSVTDKNSIPKQEEGLVNINSANETELQVLEGIGEKRAKNIVQYREQHGLFESIEEIKNISGIGNKTFEQIKSRITVE